MCLCLFPEHAGHVLSSEVAVHHPFAGCMDLAGLPSAFLPVFHLMLTIPTSGRVRAGEEPPAPWQPPARLPPLFPQLAAGGSHLVGRRCAGQVCGLCVHGHALRGQRASGAKPVTPISGEPQAFSEHRGARWCARMARNGTRLWPLVGPGDWAGAAKPDFSTADPEAGSRGCDALRQEGRPASHQGHHRIQGPRCLGASDWLPQVTCQPGGP